MITLSQFEDMLKKEWIGYFPEEYQSATVFIHEKKVRNGIQVPQITLHGITNTAPLLPIEPYYACVAQGSFVGNVMKKMAEDYQRYEKEQPHIAEIMQEINPARFETVKDKITFALVNQRNNEDFLKDAAHLPFEDLAKVFYIQLNTDMYAKVTTDLCEQWGVTPQELEAFALENMPKLSPAVLFDLDESILRGMRRNHLDEKCALQENLYALTNEATQLGAAVGFYPDLMETISERFQDPFYIIPSSVHELILLPQKAGMKLSDVKAMVRQVNKETVPAADFLSDNVYYYDTKTKEIKLMREDFEKERGTQETGTADKTRRWEYER